MGTLISILSSTPVTPGSAIPVSPPNPTDANGNPYHTTDANGNPIPLEGLSDREIEKRFFGGGPDDDPYDDDPYDGGLRKKLRF